MLPTPETTDHPAYSLKIGNDSEIADLARLQPVTLANDSTLEELRQQNPKDKRWRNLRNEYPYIYVVSWMYQCRGYIKLALEEFDVDLFEIELLNLVYPPPVDDMALVVNKARLALLSKVHGKKVSELGLFEAVFRVIFGSSTPLDGPENEDDLDNDDFDHSPYPRFEELYMDEKIEILFILMTHASKVSDFRDYVERHNLTGDMLRARQLFQHSVRDSGKSEEYLLLFEGTALYKRVVHYNALEVPKQRKAAPRDPSEHFDPKEFDVKNVKYDLVYKDIYGLNKFVQELQQSRLLKKSRAMLSVIQKRDAVSHVFSCEIRKRRVLSSRRKEVKLSRLMATRKKSSRLEAKERQRGEEIEERKRAALLNSQLELSRRSRRTRALALAVDYTDGLSRGERLSNRKDRDEGEAV